MTTFLLLLWLIPIAVNVYLDRNGRKPNYLKVNIARGMAAIVHGALFNPSNFYDYLPVFIFQITTYWLFFELALNIIRGKELMYYDRFEKDSGYIDRFFAWAGRELHVICKFASLVFMILSIILIYMNHE